MAKDDTPSVRTPDFIGQVLVVDDDGDFAAATAELLARRGCTVHTAGSSSEALAETTHWTPDVALLDLRLGTDEGVALIARLRAIQPDMLFIVITAYPQIDTAISALQEGAYDYLRKPVDPPVLLASVRRAFRYVRLQRDKAELARQLHVVRKQEAIGRLAGGVAHDFNNVLTAILGNVELLLDEKGGARPIPPRVREGLRAIERGAERAAKLTQRLLTFTQHRPLDAELVDVNELVQQMGATLRAMCHERVELVFALAADIPQVRIGVGALERMLTNLALNACEAMADGGRLQITTTVAGLDDAQVQSFGGARPGTYVVLAVSDTGCGMDTATAERVFDPFFTTKPHRVGEGVGLAEVYGMVRQADGWVTVSSQPGSGSVFRIYLPVDSAQAPIAPAIVPNAAGERITVLLCEDERPVRELIARLLVSAGFVVLAAESGEAALDLAERHTGTIDVLLTDIRMPGIDGRELARRLTERRPTMRVVLTSGYVDDGEAFHSRDGAPVLFLQKPFSPRTMIEQLRAFLDAPAG